MKMRTLFSSSSSSSSLSTASSKSRSDACFKLLTLGDSGVGKTSLLSKLLQPSSSIALDHDATVGFDFYQMTLDAETLEPIEKPDYFADSNNNFTSSSGKVGSTGRGKKNNNNFSRNGTLSCGTTIRQSIKRCSNSSSPFSSRPAVYLQFWDTAGQERFRSLTTTFFRDAAGFLVVFDVADPTSIGRVGEWIELIQAESGVDDPIVVFCGNKADLLGAEESGQDAVDARRRKMEADICGKLKSCCLASVGGVNADAGEADSESATRNDVGIVANDPAIMEDFDAGNDDKMLTNDDNGATIEKKAAMESSVVIHSKGVDAATQVDFDAISQTEENEATSSNPSAPNPTMADVETQTNVNAENSAVDDAIAADSDVDASGAAIVEETSTTASAPASSSALDYFETSAKTGANVEAAVKRLTERIVAAREAAAKVEAEAAESGEGGGGSEGGEKAAAPSGGGKIPLTNRFFLRKDHELSVFNEWGEITKAKCNC